MLKFSIILISALTVWSAHGEPLSPVDYAIESSTKQIIRKDRASALNILSNVLKKPNLSKAQRDKLLQAFEVASEIFFTDRGQSLFEAGRNLYLISSPEAVKKMNEALALESGNSLVLWGLVKAHFKEKQCDQADLEFEKLPVRIQEDKGAFKPLLAYCRSEALSFWSNDEMPPFYTHFFRGVFFYWKGGLKEARTELEKSRKLNPQFPETLFWLWKIDPEEQDFAIKYKRDCEAQKLQLVKKFEEFPQVCHFLPEVSEVEMNNEM